MSKIVLSADIGKYETELFGRDISLNEDSLKIETVRTKMYDLDNGFIEVEGNSYLIEFEDKKYIVGDQGQEKSYDTSKTQLLHQLSCYTMITKFLKPNTENNELYMTLACPISVIQSAEAKEEYKEFIKGKGITTVFVNGNKYTFEIKDITLKTEGSGIVFLEPKRFTNQTVGIVDLGGLNMGFSLYRNKSCKKEDRFIEECGTDRLIEIVREQLSIYKKGNIISEDEATKALYDNGLKEAGKIDSKSSEYITKAKVLYYNEVLNYIKAHKFNINRLDSVVFVGGTTNHIKDIITNELRHSYIPDEPQLCTAKGLYKVAFKKYGGEA
ncbi:ParM/StbA family protein [Clostridium botulinum]|uniref:ParM/StbA family protein n=1 Tax=Clostridium botulinum TaxID=1491 RepID=UPI000773CEAC|nr:ParM/StbA family protein [Clostridium botulinum]